MTENNNNSLRRPWWSSPTVLVSVVGFLLLQASTLLIWGTRLDSRVGYLETMYGEHDRRLARSDEASRKLDVIDERQRQGQEALSSAARRIEALYETVIQ